MGDRRGLSRTPGSDDPRGWLAFVAETRALVGALDPVALMALAPDRFAEVIVGAAPHQLATPEEPGAWSLNEVLAHLADVELAWGFRLRQTLTSPSHVMDGFDQGAWATRLHYRELDAHESLALFGAQRRRNVGIWRSLTDADWAREARHSQRPGGESLRAIATLIAGHDIRHLRQAVRLRGALGLSPVQGGEHTTW